MNPWWIHTELALRASQSDRRRLFDETIIHFSSVDFFLARKKNFRFRKHLIVKSYGTSRNVFHFFFFLLFRQINTRKRMLLRPDLIWAAIKFFFFFIISTLPLPCLWMLEKREGWRNHYPNVIRKFTQRTYGLDSFPGLIAREFVIEILRRKLVETFGGKTKTSFPIKVAVERKSNISHLPALYISCPNAAVFFCANHCREILFYDHHHHKTLWMLDDEAEKNPKVSFYEPSSLEDSWK